MISEKETVHKDVPSSSHGVPRMAVLYAMFLLISFLGWVLEEVFFVLRGRGFADRGFLSFPICIVYGWGIISTYLLFGLPHRMRIFSTPLSNGENGKQKFAKFLLYVLLSGIVCTLCELAVGVFMHGAFGILMWDYRETPWNFGPYICLPFALIWGVLTYFFMRFAFLPLLHRIALMQRRTLFALLLPLTVFLFFDLAMNCTYSFYNRAHMALW